MERQSLPRVTVVDDEPNLVALLVTMLNKSGFDVTSYADGESALEGFVKDQPSLLLLDVWMPGMSGHQVCRYIRETLKDTLTPVIIMTGNDDYDAISEAFDSGATDFLPKPINIPLLVQRIRYALRNTEAWQQRAAFQHQMLQSEKMASLGQLAAGVAHEINNPIGYVLSNVQVLSGYTQALTRYLARLETIGQSPAEAAERSAQILQGQQEDRIAALLADLPEMLTDIEDGVLRISDIVKSLKIYAHPEEDKLTPTDLTELLQSVGKMMVGELKNRAEVSMALPESPVWVLANPSKLYQVVMNLLINAVQSIDHDHGLVRMELRTHGRQALIDVTDNGAGMSEDVQARIFDPFFTTKEIGVGTGLGLSVSKAIIDKHHGQLTVMTQPGQGTTFTVSLSLTDAPL
ncbi:MAG: sensor histidine kinase [Saccharospirillum sp.]